MRSNRLSKRALDQTDQNGWPREQEVEELDVPGNRAVSVPKAAACKCGAEGCEDCDKDGNACECGTEGCGKCGSAKTADAISDAIRQAIKFITQHKSDPNLLQQLTTLPIAHKPGVSVEALKAPITQFVQSGNTSALASELETIMSGKRTMASKQAGEEAANEAEAPAKEKGEAEQPSGFVEPMRPEPTEEVVKPTADNGSGLHRRVKLDEVSRPSSAPSAWEVDNKREMPHKAGKRATPTAWSVDNTRSLPQDQAELTTEEQIEDKKNAALEVYVPKTAEEVKFIVASSAPWIGEHLAHNFNLIGVGPSAFIINASEAIAVVSAAGEVYDSPVMNATKHHASLVKKAFWGKEAAAAGGDTDKEMHKAPHGDVQHGQGGASEEVEPEEASSVDSTVVRLLEACKAEWANLGEPVNPGTWSKEIERAILNLNDEIVAAIGKVEDKLVEGEFYSKNVDEGVEGHGGSDLDSLNVAPPDMGMEDELGMEESSKLSFLLNVNDPRAEGEPLWKDVEKAEKDQKKKEKEDSKPKKASEFTLVTPDTAEEIVELAQKTPDCVWCITALRIAKMYKGKVTFILDASGTPVAAKDLVHNKTFTPNDRPTHEYDHLFEGAKQGKKAAEMPDVTSTETRKALKHTQELKSDIADRFFQFKKVVQNANDSALVKSLGEEMVGMKTKLEDVEKLLSKQLSVLENAETAIEEKKKETGKKSMFLGLDGFSTCAKCGETFSHSPHGKQPETPVCPECSEGKSASAKTANCPTCGATVMQNGTETNGVPCPNCVNKPANKQPTQPGAPTPAVAQKPGAPQKPNQPGVAGSGQTKVQQFGSPRASLLSGLFIAGGE